jgi:hypothetical protein
MYKSEKIWQAIKEREKNFNEDWLIVITTDHGRDVETGKHHGGQIRSGAINLDYHQQQKIKFTF